MNRCANTKQDIMECPCAICAPLRRMIQARRRKRALAHIGVPLTVPTGETDRRLKSALTALPPSDRE